MRLCLILMTVFGVGNGYTLADLRRLKEHLFKDYDPTLRPLFNQSERIEVTFSLVLRSLINFDMNNGQLAMMGYTLEFWEDEQMRWNDTEFREIERLSLEPRTLWRPYTAQLNAMSEEVQLESLLVLSTGLVFRSIVRVYYTFCELDMRYYPVDRHVCKFEFMSVRHTVELLKMKPLFDGVDISTLAPHGEWTVKDTSTGRFEINVEAGNVQGDGIIYNVVLERQPSFNIIHRSIPLFILVLGTIFIHLVPLKSGERISYAVTVLLSFVFWQAILADELPKNSSKISIFSMVVTACLGISGSSTVASVILCRVASFEPDRPIPERLQNLARQCRWRKKREAKYLKQLSNVSFSDENVNNSEDKIENLNGKTLHRGLSETKDDLDKLRTVTWTEAANSIDVLIFMVNIVLLIFAAIIFVLIFTL